MPSALEIVERIDLETKLAQAVAALSEVQRVAVWMRYWEQMPPRAISQQLGVPVETVRTRLKRALASLRSTLERTRGSDWKAALLPIAGVPVGISPPVIAASGLAGIALGTGVIAMKTKLWIATGVAVCVALMGTWYASPAWLGEASEEVRLEEAQGEARHELSTSPQVERSRDEISSPTAAAVVPPIPTRPVAAFIRGRCLSAEDQAPLGGVRIALRGRSRDPQIAAGSAWVDPQSATSGADGRFEIAFDLPEGMQFFLELSAEGRTPKRGVWGRIARAQVIDIGDVEMLVGHEVSGRVIDESGSGIARATVSVRGMPIGLKDHPGVIDHVVTTSKEDGTFAFGAVVPAGTWEVEADARGWRQPEPVRAEVATHGTSPLHIVMRRMNEIAGIVVDDAGEPVEGVHLAAGPPSSQSTPTSISGKDGAFVFYARVDDPPPARIAVVNAGRCEPPEVADATEHPWGTSGLRIVLRRARTVDLLVVEAGSDTPVLDYAVQCFGEREKSSSRRGLRLGGEHAGGHLIIDPVVRGTNRLVVHPTDRALLPSGDLLFEVGEGPLPSLRVEVERMLRFRVRAEARDGRALSGAKVEVIALGSTKLEQEEPVADRFDSVSTYAHGIADFDYPRLLCAARTDVEGYAEVFAVLPPRRLAVRVTHPEARPLLLEPAVFERERTLVLVLSRGASITGRVQAPRMDLERLSVSATRKDLPKSERGFRVTARVESDGRFALLGLTAGLHDVQLVYRIPHRSSSGAGWQTVSLVGVGAEVALEEDGAKELVLDASAHAPGQLRGRVLYSERAPAAGRVVLAMRDGPICGEYLLDAQGRFEAEELLPGTYRPILRLPRENGAGDLELRGEGTLAITPGTTLEHDLRFVRRHLAVRVLDRDGDTPLAGATVRWETAETHGAAKTDELGWLAIDPAPPEVLDLLLVVREGARETREPLGSVSIPNGQARAEVSVTRRRG